MSTKRKAGIAILIIAAAVTTASLYTGRGDSGQASEGIAAENQPVSTMTSPVVYTVQKGDSLWSVAKKFNVNLKLLAYVNSLDSEAYLMENSEIQIPDSGKITYKVEAGDTLWGLAKKYNTTVESIVKENGTAIMEMLPADKEIIVPVDAEIFDGGEMDIPKSSASDKEAVVKIPKLGSWPVQGAVSSVFGRRWGRMHKGIDIAAENGEPIRTVEDGVVVFAGDRGTYGNTVIINHGNGFRTLYAHASKLTVEAGERVEKGQVIAKVGNTGRSTGPHLHLELLFNGQPVNPEDYLPKKL